MQGHELPDGWCFRPLSEIADIVSGGTPSTENPRFWENGTIPWATPTDITKNGDRVLRDTAQRITVEGLKNSSARLLPPRTLLMTSRATLGEVKVALEAVSTNQGFKSLTPKEDVDVWFLYYQMLFNKSRYTRLGIGSTFLEVNKKETEKFAILLAPKNEQRQIAAILIALDDCIENTQSLIAKYNAIKQGMMQDLFTRGIDENFKLRPSCEEVPSLYCNSIAGPLPKCWAIESLGSICSWHSGGTPNKGNAAFWGGSIPWISPKDMKVFEIKDGQDFITDSAIQSSAKVVGPGTVLIVVRGMILAHSFPVGITSRQVAFNQDMKALVCEGQVRGRFLAHWLVAHASKILSKATEATHGTKRFDSSDLYSIPFPVPANDEQERIIQLLDNLDALQLAERNNLQKLQHIKNGLMQDLLTGKVRVKVDESTESERDVGVHQS